jgi:hypothetical protein
MKKQILKIAVVGCLTLIGADSYAQDLLSMTPAEYKEYIVQCDGQMYFDDLGMTMSIAKEGNIASQLRSSTDGQIYDGLQLCYRMYKDLSSVPQYVVEYVLANFETYENYYVSTLSKTGDVNDAAAAFLLLTGFNGRCKAVNKSFEKFCEVCDDFTEDAANSIVADKGKKNGYRGAGLMLLTSQLVKRIQNGTIAELSDKTKKNLVKTYDGIVKECDKALKKNNPEYNQYLPPYKEMYELVLNSLK